MNRFEAPLSPKYNNEMPSYGSQKFYLITKNKKRGLVDENDKQILKAQYDEIELLPSVNVVDEEYYFIVSQNKKKGIIQFSYKYGIYKNMKACLPVIFDNIKLVWELYDSGVFEDHYFLVTKDGKKGVLNSDNEVFILIVYENLEDVCFDGLHCYYDDNLYFVFGEKGKKGVLDRENNLIIPAIYDEIEKSNFILNDGPLYVKVKTGDKFGLLNMRNKIVLPVVYDEIEYFDEKLFLVTKAKKKGLVLVNINCQNDERNTLISDCLPLVYDYIELLERDNYKEKFLLVTQNNEKGIIHIELNYDDDLYHTNVKNCLSDTYDEIKVFDKQFLMITKDGKKGILNFDTELLIPVDYDRLKYLPIKIGSKTGHYFFAARGKNKGLLDIHGKEVIPLVYDALKKIKIEDSGLIRFAVKKDGEIEEITIKVDDYEIQK